MIFIALLHNLSFLVALSIVSGFLDKRFPRNTRTGEILQGVLFGTVAVVGMLQPLVIEKGLIFDGRSVVISLCSLFFGPLSGFIASLFSVILRIYQGGPGVYMGVLVVCSSYLIGLLYFNKRKESNRRISVSYLWIFGLFVHFAMLLMTLALPAHSFINVLEKIAVPVITMYPLATILIGKILSDQETALSSLMALKDSEAKFRSYIEYSPYGIFLTNESGQIKDSNPASAEITGYTREELNSLNLIHFYPEYEIPKVLLNSNRLINTGRSSGEFEFLNKNKHVGFWHINSIKLSSGDYLSFIKDITERKSDEKKLGDSLREKELLLQEIHHRIKNNFQMVSNLLNLQALNVSDEIVVKVLQNSQTRIKAMALVHELIYGSESFLYLNINEYLNRLVEIINLTYQLDSKNVKIIIDVEDINLSIDLLVPLGLIINELLSNSLKHSFPAGQSGEIYVGLVKRNDGSCRLIIKDNGISLPPDYAEISKNTLGLFLVNTLVKQLKGNIVFTNLDIGKQIKIEFNPNVMVN